MDAIVWRYCQFPSRDDVAKELDNAQHSHSMSCFSAQEFSLLNQCGDVEHHVFASLLRLEQDQHLSLKLYSAILLQGNGLPRQVVYNRAALANAPVVYISLRAVQRALDKKCAEQKTKKSTIGAGIVACALCFGLPFLARLLVD